MAKIALIMKDTNAKKIKSKLKSQKVKKNIEKS